MKPWKKSFGIWVPDRSLSDNRGFIAPGVIGAVAGSRRRTAATSGYYDTVMSDTPLAYYRLGESSGITAADETSNAYDATYTPNSGGAWTGGTLGVSGAITGNTGIQCNGSTGYVRCPAGLSGSSRTTLTIEFWLNRSATNKIVPVGFANTTFYRANVLVFSDGKFYLQFEGGSASYPNASVANTGWIHVCAVYDGGLSGINRAKLYINGSNVTLTAGGADPATSLYLSLGQMDIGREFTTTRYAASTETIDEVAVYAAALTSTQVATHYNAR